MEWTAQRIADARAALAGSRTLTEACHKLNLGDSTALTRAFSRRGLGDPSTLLGTGLTGAPAAAPPPVRPALDLEAARRREDARATTADVRALQAQLLAAHGVNDFYAQALDTAPLPVVSRGDRARTGKRPGTIVTLASDQHCGETVRPEETSSGNTYDVATFQQRMGEFWANVMWLRSDIQRSVTAEDHVLSLNGDLISGSIHVELEATNECGPVTQVVTAVAAVEAGIRQLAPTCRRLIIPCVHGNHGRGSLKSRIKDGFEHSYEGLAFHMLRAATRDLPNVEWIIPRAESVQLVVQSKRVRFQHGTFLKSQGGVGGILVPLSRWATRKACADVYVFGHFHQLCYFPAGGATIVVNGSLIGDSSYNEELGLGSQPPRQANFVLDGDHGLRRFDPVSVS